MIIDNSGTGIATLGRDEDRYVAHVAPGERVVPPVISADTQARLSREMAAAGLDPDEYIVGPSMSINPITGQPEFGWLKKTVKSVKKVVKKAAPVLGVASMFIPGLGTAMGGMLGKLGSGVGSLLGKVPGIGGALQSGAGLIGKGITGLTSGIGSLVSQVPGMGQLGTNLQNFGTAAQTFADPSFGLTFGDAFGALKTGIGSLFDPKQMGGQLLQSVLGGGQMGYPGYAGGMYYPSPQGGMYDPYGMMGGQMYGGGFMPAFYGPYGPSQTQQVQQPQQQQGILDFLSRKLLPQSIEDMIKGEDGTITLGSMFGKEGGGLNTLGAAGLAGLVGKVAYDAAKERQGGLAATPSVTMDPLGRYQLSKALGTGGTREQFGLGPAPKSLSFNMGGEARQYFSQGGLAMVEELDMRDGGESAGPGTGTSDDIPAMLSDGEYVMTAKATRGAGAYETKKTPTGIELVKTGDPSREAGVENMRELMTMFEAV